MAKIRRNGPCPCGSGSKAKRCAHERGRAPVVHRLPGGILRAVEPDLVGLAPDTVRSLLDQVHRLSGIHPTLRLDLTTLTAAEERAVEAVLLAPSDTSEPVRSRLIRQVLVALDSPGRRIGLARAVLSLRDEGHISSDLAAAAVLQLAMEQSALFSCCVLESLLAGHS